MPYEPQSKDLVTILPVCPISIADYYSTSATELQFAGRKWMVKESSAPVSPGTNRFSADPDDVWGDEHLAASAVRVQKPSTGGCHAIPDFQLTQRGSLRSVRC